MSDKDYRNFITRLSGNHYTKAQVDRKVARRKKMREWWAKAVPADIETAIQCFPEMAGTLVAAKAGDPAARATLDSRNWGHLYQ